MNLPQNKNTNLTSNINYFVSIRLNLNNTPKTVPRQFKYLTVYLFRLFLVNNGDCGKRELAVYTFKTIIIETVFHQWSYF